MNFNNKYVDELIELRKEAREKRNWQLSDEIRDFLDANHSFVFDTQTGQIVYHQKSGSRQDFIKIMKNESKGERIFDSWLVSLNAGLY